MQPESEESEENDTGAANTNKITDSVSFDKRMIDNNYSLHRRSLISVESGSEKMRRRLSKAQQTQQTKPIASFYASNSDNQHRFNKNPNFESTQNETNLKKEFLAEVRRKSADKAAHENHLVHENNIDSDKLAEFYI